MRKVEDKKGHADYLVSRALDVASHWSYLGEGNANAVFRYRGPCEDLDPYVLRVAKASMDMAVSSSHRDEDATFRSWEYTRKTVAPKLGKAYIPRGWLLSTKGRRGFLMCLDAKVLQTAPRPTKRKQSQVAVDASHVLLLEDCTTTLRAVPLPLLAGDIFCFEIKPKSPQPVSPSGQGRQLCRFCLKQAMLVEAKRGHERSRYCPRRMFSSGPAVIKETLCDLLETPQNNLRVFWNGCQLEGANLPRALSQIDRSPFLKQLSKRLREMGHHDREKPIRVLLECVAKALAADQVLNKIECIQREGACEDIEEGIFGAGFFADVVNNGLDVLLDRINLPAPRNECAPAAGLAFASAARRVTSYLLSRTMMDCSVMVSIRGTFAARAAIAFLRENVNKQASGTVTTALLRGAGAIVHYDIRVVDTDRKPFRKLPLYKETERALRQHDKIPLL